MNALQRYHDLQKRLVHIRWCHLGHESDEEDQLLDLMDEVWEKLTAGERDQLNEEPALPAPTLSDPNPVFEDTDIDAAPGPVRRLVAA